MVALLAAALAAGLGFWLGHWKGCGCGCRVGGSRAMEALRQELGSLRRLAKAADGLLAAMGTKDHPIEAWHAAQFEELEMRAADYWGQFPKEGE